MGGQRAEAGGLRLQGDAEAHHFVEAEGDKFKGGGWWVRLDTPVDIVAGDA